MKPLVLISGGAGFIGSHTADLLLKKGYRVRILDNLSSKTHNGHWPKYLDERVEKVKGDVRNKKDWERALKGVDYVIHLAAWMDLMPEFSKFFSINVVGTANLYEVIVNEKLPIKKVIVASSQFVYGQGRWRCKKDGVVFPKDREDTNLQKGIWDPVCPKCGGKITPLENTEDHQDPPNQYAISKYAEEVLALRLGFLYKIPTVALRYSIVHGARQTLKNVYSGALRIFVLQILNGEPPLIFEDGGQLRDYVSVKDVATANLLVMKNKNADFRVFNVGSGKGYTVRELSLLIAKTLGKKVSVKASGMYRVGDIRHAVSNISQLAHLGWRPKFSEDRSIDEFIQYVNETKSPSKSKISKMLKDMYKKGAIKRVADVNFSNSSRKR
jgi:dTDP-L-rhamnose 4-epimerase